jgi:hypothetical protein
MAIDTSIYFRQESMSSLQTSDLASSFRGKLSKAKAEVQALESQFFFERPYYTFQVMEALTFRRHVLKCDYSPGEIFPFIMCRVLH